MQAERLMACRVIVMCDPVGVMMSMMSIDGRTMWRVASRSVLNPLLTLEHGLATAIAIPAPY